MRGISSYNFDVDRYINPIVPRSRLYLLPKPISWFLGHREKPPKQIGNVVTWFWAFIGAFCGILVIEAVFQTDMLQSDGAPIIIGSLVCSHLQSRNHSTETLPGRCGRTRIQHNRFTTVSTSKCSSRSSLLLRDWSRHHQAIQTEF